MSISFSNIPNTAAPETDYLLLNGNGSTTAFTYSFKITDDDDIQVIIRSATGTETVKSKGTHYNVSGVGNNSGTVTYYFTNTQNDITANALHSGTATWAIIWMAATADITLTGGNITSINVDQSGAGYPA